MAVAERLRHDDVVMSVLRSAPDLAMVYIAERLGTSQQILLDAVAGDIKLAQEEGSVRGGRSTPAGGDVSADHAVDDPVRADRRADPRRRCAGRRTGPLPERIPEVMTGSTALNAARRTAELAELADGATVDVIVIGGGITGAGIALDAATRGLRVVLVEKHDLAFGTSRWSSKLVHGGLRYLATGNVGIARRSAIERGILMTRNAPHLVKAMPQLVPLLPSMNHASRALVRVGFVAGDGLRKLAGTPASALPRSRRIDAKRAPSNSPPPCAATAWTAGCSPTTAS